MSEIASKSAETLIVRVGIQIFAILGGILIARELGPEAKGLYFYAGTVVSTAQMFWSGQAAAIVWQYGRRGDHGGAVFHTAIRILAIAAALIAAVVAGIAIAFPQQHVLFAAAAVLPFALFAQTATGFFLADGDVRSLNVQQVLISAAPVVIYGPLLLFAHVNVWLVLAVWSLGWLAGAVYSWLRLRRHAAKPPDVPAELARTQLSYGAQMSLNGLVAYLNFRIDAFLVLFMLGRQALGVYSIGIGLGELLFFISRPIVTAARGRIARSGERESAELSAKCLRHTFALVLLCSVAIYFAGPALVVLVYGKQFAGAGPVLRYLLPGVIAYSAMPVLSAFFSQQIGNPRIPLAFSTISTVLCALVTAAILPHVGIVGGAIATSVSYFTAFSLAVVYFMRLTGTPLSRMFFLDAQDLHAYKELAIAAIARQKALATRLTSR